MAERINASLPEALACELRDAAEADGRSVSSVVRSAVRAWLNRRADMTGEIVAVPRARALAQPGNPSQG